MTHAFADVEHFFSAKEYGDTFIYFATICDNVGLFSLPYIVFSIDLFSGRLNV